MPRLAIIDKDKCKPDKCAKECIKGCPPQRAGKQVIEIEDIGKNLPIQTNKSDFVRTNINSTNLTDKRKIAKIAENLCIGCNQCVRVCPFNAIRIINLPEENPTDIIHRYNPNGFRLYKLPILKPNIITGIIGANGVGKTTLIDILTDTIRPNFEQFSIQIEPKEIISKFRGSVLQDYLKNLYSNKYKFSIKEQKIKLGLKNNAFLSVRDFIKSKSINLDTPDLLPESYYTMNINKMLDANFNTLSGGELQRLLCWVCANVDADVYVFDEPSNFLDVKQRLEISRLIKSIVDTLGTKPKYVIVIEHDLSMLDYMADELYIIYGKPSAYGIVSKPLSVLDGINMYLSGYISTQNIRFRDEEFNLKPSSEIVFGEILSEEQIQENKQENILENMAENILTYPSSQIEREGFRLIIPSGTIKLSNSICVILGENGTGKTTFINLIGSMGNLSVSVKEQGAGIKKYIGVDGTYPSVLELLHHKIKSNYFNPIFQSDVIKQLEIEELQTRKINELSGGELQRVLIALCLGTPADLYLIDEPSANLDIEKRLNVTKVIKKFIMSNSKSAFIIEHDIMMCVAFAQEVQSKILLIKQDSEINNIRTCSISQPLDFSQGINGFLQLMSITMRISGHNRPRINKCGSQLDQEQKKNGKYYGI